MAKLFIYGAGATGDLLYDALVQNNITIVGFIDEYTTKTSLRDKPIYKLADVPQPQDITLYLSIHEGLYNYHDVKNQLQSFGFANIIDLHELASKYQEVIDISRFHSTLYLRQDLSEMINESKLSLTRQLIHNSSLDLFDKLVAFRRKPSPENYPFPTEKNQYFTNQVKIFDKANFVLVDCGAYVGDTIQKIKNYTQGHLKKVIAFEPDPNSFKRLESFCNSKETEEIESYLFPCGVWDENTLLRLSLSGSGSKISNTSEGTTIPVVAIDHAIKNIKPDLIKMDLEGAELKALQGCSELIKKYKPNLAISLYHKPEDIWEIPLYLHEIQPDYKMYLEVYGFTGFETVLFCSIF